ncbi:hypothetical protein D3C81_920520 [compost metagenome]
MRILRGMGRLPWFVVIILPFALERLGVTAFHPKFRLLQMDGFHTGVNSRSNPFHEKVGIANRWHHVRNIYRSSVDNHLAVLIFLGFIPMGATVRLAVQVVLVTSPGHPGHQMYPIPPRRPLSDTLGHRFPYAIHHHEIRLQVIRSTITAAFLEPGPFLCPCSSRHAMPLLRNLEVR